MNLASRTLTFHWWGIAWLDYSQHCWGLFPLSHEGSGSCSWATADLLLAGWQLCLLSCWDLAAADLFGGSEGCCDTARTAWCPLASRKGVGSWRTWPLPAHMEQRSSFCTGRNTVSWSQGGYLVSYLVQHFCVLWQIAKARDLLPEVAEHHCVSRLTVKTWFSLALRKGEKGKGIF